MDKKISEIKDGESIYTPTQEEFNRINKLLVSPFREDTFLIHGLLTCIQKLGSYVLRPIHKIKGIIHLSTDFPSTKENTKTS